MKNKSPASKAKAKPTPPLDTAEQSPPGGGLAALIVRTKQIQARRGEVIRQIIALEDRGTLESPDDKVQARRSDAIELLNGAAAPLLSHLLPDAPDGNTLKGLRAERDTIDKALELADKLYSQLAAKEADERFAEHRAEYIACLHQIALTLIALERCLQHRDQLVHKIAYVGPIEGEGFALAGRLANPGSQIYRFLQTAAARGWIDGKTVETEIINARKESK